MKKYIGILSIGAVLMGGLSSCNDFLDREPLDKVTPEVYFKSPEDLAAYCIKCYSFKTVDEKYGINLFGTDNHTDNQAGTGNPTMWIPGKKLVPSDAGEWKWEEIRACNYFFDNVLPKYEKGEFEGNATVQREIKHYIGEMYVLRAYKYFVMLQKFGDLPIVTTAMQVPNKEELMEASKRRPRHKVAEFIINDLKKAEEMLMETPPGGKNRISRDVAYLLHSRVALYEGTWEKHHVGTAFVPGGKGWPGKDAEGFTSETYKTFLEEAITSAKVVGDKMIKAGLTKNSNTPEGMDASYASLNDYYTMFCDENMESYSEVLMWRRFDLIQGVTNNLQMELMRNGGGSGWTLGMVNSFLMRDGLPIYASSQYNKEDRERKGIGAMMGLDGKSDLVADRDSRLVIFTKKPRDIKAKKYNADKTVVTEADTLSYGDVNYYNAEGKADTCVIDYLFGNAQTVATTGFIVKKGKHYNATMADHNLGTSGGIVFRGAEALLNYMEAYYERYETLVDKDKTLDTYWKALRSRAKVSEDYNATIRVTNMSIEAEGDWGAYSAGKLVDEKLYNIRRERRNELCAEGFRMDDLKRWRALDQMETKAYPVQGMKFWNTIYSENEALMSKVKVHPKEGNMSAENLGDYILPYFKVTENNSIAEQGGFKFTPAHYLEPIGAAAFRQTAVNPGDFSTSVIYQNPGWGIEGNTGAKSIE